MTSISSGIKFLLLAAAASAPVPAMAAPPVEERSPFAVAAVADAELASVRGQYVPRQYVAVLADRQARDDFRQTASVGTLTFDNWFNDIGSALIVNALLAGQR